MSTTATAQAEPAAPAPLASAPPEAAAAPAAITTPGEAMLAALADPSMLTSPEVSASLFAEPGTAPAVQPAVVPPPAAPAAETPTPAGDPPPAEAPVAEVPAEAEPAAEEAPEEPVIDPVTSLPLPVQAKRIRMDQFSDIESRAMTLKKDMESRGIPMPLKEAIQRVEDMLAPPEAEEEAPPEAAPVTTAQASTQALESEVAALKTRIKQYGEDRELMSPEFAQATIDLADKSAELAQAKAAVISKQTVTGAQFTAQREANLAAVLAIYPKADDIASPLGAHVAAKVAQIQGDPNHPQRDLLNGTDATSKVVAASVAELKKSFQAQGIDDQTIARLIGEKGSAPVAPAAQPARSVPRNAAVSAPGHAAPPPPVAAMTAQQALSEVASNPDVLNSPEVQAAIFGAPSGSFMFGRA